MKFLSTWLRNVAPHAMPPGPQILNEVPEHMAQELAQLVITPCTYVSSMKFLSTWLRN